MGIFVGTMAATEAGLVSEELGSKIMDCPLLTLADMTIAGGSIVAVGAVTVGYGPIDLEEDDTDF